MCGKPQATEKGAGRAIAATLSEMVSTAMRMCSALGSGGEGTSIFRSCWEGLELRQVATLDDLNDA